MPARLEEKEEQEEEAEGEEGSRRGDGEAREEHDKCNGFTRLLLLLLEEHVMPALLLLLLPHLALAFRVEDVDLTGRSGCCCCCNR